MTWEDLADVAAVTVIPAVLLALLGLSATAIARTPREAGRGRYAISATALAAVMLAAAASVVWWWGVGFDYADSDRDTPAYVDPAMVASFWIGVGAYTEVLATGLLAHVVVRRRARR